VPSTPPSTFPFTLMRGLRKMKHLLTASALALILASPVLAQQTSTSQAGSAATANQGQVQSQGSLINGGSSANNGGVQVGPDTSSSNSNASANTSSLSVSKGGNATGGAGGSSTATSGAANSSNAQDITFNSPATPTHTSADVKSAPTVYAPALATTLTETCMGSTSASGSGMGWGLSIGSTWEDKGCTRRLNADRVAGLTGDREAARAILCDDKEVYDAYERVGRPCPQSPEYKPLGPESFVPAPPPPPPAQYLYAAPPPPPAEEPPTAAQQAAPGTMAPIPNPEEPKEPRN
jgi:hypothetical protein